MGRRVGGDLFDPLEMGAERNRRLLQVVGSTTELGVGLRDWICWRGEIGEDLQLGY